MSNYTYSSVFAPHFEDFQRMKDAMGYKASNMHYVLKEFDLFFQKEEVTEPMITKDLVLKWRKGKVNETERTLYDKWSILSQFARYMCHVGFVCYVPRTMCCDCIAECKYSALSVNGNKRLHWILPIVVVLLFFIGIVIGSKWEVPMVNLKWG
ncbi:MAG: hypothetical protein ABFC28_07905, partial [Rikenellaceae bacterium]